MSEAPKAPPSGAETARLAGLSARILAAGTPLPGLLPYENRRPITVLGRFGGLHAIEFLCQRFPHLTREHWLVDFQAGRFLDEAGRVMDAEDLVQGGQRLIRLLPGTTEPEVKVDVEVVYDDAVLLVVNKPAPLPVHACGRFNRHTLGYLLEQAFPEWRLRNCHRLDADTSGLMVFAKTKTAARQIQQQFELRQVCKYYLARVHGRPPHKAWQSEAEVSRQSVDAGARALASEGLSAETSFRQLGEYSDNTSLVLAEPRTGRTHQLRLHLADAGLPIVGDPAYAPEGSTEGGLVGAGICLHAWRLKIAHPDGFSLELEATPPAWSEASPENGLM